jgi:hypothetical protein
MQDFYNRLVQTNHRPESRPHRRHAKNPRRRKRRRSRPLQSRSTSNRLTPPTVDGRVKPGQDASAPSRAPTTRASTFLGSPERKGAFRSLPMAASCSCKACRFLVFVSVRVIHDVHITPSKRRHCEQARAVGPRMAGGRSKPRLGAAAACSMAAAPLGHQVRASGLGFSAADTKKSTLVVVR